MVPEIQKMLTELNLLQSNPYSYLSIVTLILISLLLKLQLHLSESHTLSCIYSVIVHNISFLSQSF